jgi:hypothetical protein
MLKNNVLFLETTVLAFDLLTPIINRVRMFLSMKEDNYIRAGGNGFFLQRIEGAGNKLLMSYVP